MNVSDGQLTNSTNQSPKVYPGFSTADISAKCIEKITSLEKEISEETKEHIVLIAYRSDEPIS